MSMLERRDRLIPWYFVMFFAVVALMNGIMITLAFRTHTGTVTEHPYEKGLAYNQVVKAAETQAALGWKAQIAYTDGMLCFALRDAHHHPLTVDSATATITRPTREGMDFTQRLTGEKTPLTFPAKGVWDVRVNAMHRGVPYQQSMRVMVP